MNISRREFMTKASAVLGGFAAFKKAAAQTQLSKELANPRKPPLNTESFCAWFNNNYRNPAFDGWIEEARKNPLAFLESRFSLTSQQRSSAQAGYPSAKHRIDDFINMVAEGRRRWRERSAGGGQGAPAPKMARNPSEGSVRTAECPGGYRTVEWSFTLFGHTCTGTYQECIK